MPPFKVGDRVRRSSWPLDEYVTITAVGKTMFLGIYSDGGDDTKSESDWRFEQGDFYGGAWVPWEPPTKRYIVEIRCPKGGERYVTPGGYVTTATLDFAYDKLPVIVGEVESWPST